MLNFAKFRLQKFDIVDTANDIITVMVIIFHSGYTIYSYNREIVIKTQVN